jgi:CRISPR-associated endonuclease Csn1
MANLNSSIPLRFAFTLGRQYIGWSVLTIDKNDTSARPTGLSGCGVRLFDDSRSPLDGTPLSEQRRGPRAARRRRDRFLQRRQRLSQMLIGFGLMPTDPNARAHLVTIDPYRLRAEALDRPITAHEIGRVLVHLNQRRGFKWNRNANSDDRDEQGIIAEGTERLIALMAATGTRTFGEFLWTRHRGPDGMSSPRHRQSVRIRRESEGREASYAYYPTRSMLEDEFDAIMIAQRPHHHSILTDDRIALLRAEIFFQRSSKPPPRGRCPLVPTEARLPRSLPSVEACAIYEIVNSLRFEGGPGAPRRLTQAQRDDIASRLLQGRNVTLAMLRKITGSPADAHFRIAVGDASGLKNYVSQSARLLAADTAFGATWHIIPLAQKDDIVGRLIGHDDEGALCAWLRDAHQVSAEVARNIARLSFRPGTAKLGPTANAAVLAQLTADDVPTYAEAVQRAGRMRDETWHPAKLGPVQPRALLLPYYAQVLSRHVLPGTDASGDDPLEAVHGRLADPTLHRCFRQLQKLVNALIRKHGRPAEIIVDVARNFRFGERERPSTNPKVPTLDGSHRSILKTLSIPITREALLRMRLHDEQAQASGGTALCPYSLKPITREALFSDLVIIDHILPYSRTLDDTPANKVVCFRTARRGKRQRSPYEAFGMTARWAAIAANAHALPANKRWRFTEDAMAQSDIEAEDRAARQLDDTRYVARLARAYLAAVAPPNSVHATTGRLTAMLRRRWGLNSILGGDTENADEPSRNARDDHRHHAIDAIVIGATDPALLREMCRRADALERQGRDWRPEEAAPDEPFPGMLKTAKRHVHDIVVSRKPDRGKGGPLHQETAYGIVRDDNEAALIGALVTRKAVTALAAADVDSVRDRDLRAALQTATAPYRDDQGRVRNEAGYKRALKEFSEARGVRGREQGVRRVRIGKAQKEFVVIKDRRSGGAYKALIAGENHHVDIVQLRDGSWQGFAATRFEVNQKGWRPVWERERLGGKLVMRVHKGDVIAVNDEAVTRFMTVHRLSPSNNVLYLAEHYEGGVLRQRHHDARDPFRWDYASIRGLQGRRARLVDIDILGNVHERPSNVGPAPESL